MAAYSPRTDLLTPSVAPDTEGYGPGLTAGMNNFSRLMEMGITNQRQDDRDQLAYERKTGMVDRSENRADQKTLMTKADEVDFTDGLFDSIQMQMPNLISDEMNQRYRASSLPGKRAIALQAQASLAAAMKSQIEADRRAADRQDALDMVDVPESDRARMNANGSYIPPTKRQPQPGFQDMGGGIGAYYGPDGKPINADSLLRQGPAGIEPALPRQTPALRQPAPLMIDGIPHKLNPQTGAYEPVPVQKSAGNPNAAAFNIQ